MKKTLFLWIICLVLPIVGCAGKGDFKTIHQKIENQEPLSSDEISSVLDYLEEAMKNQPDDPLEMMAFYEKNYPYALDFVFYIGTADNDGLITGLNKKRLKQLMQEQTDSDENYNSNDEMIEIVRTPNSDGESIPRTLSEVDESLFDMVADREYVLSGDIYYKVYRIGNNMKRIFQDTGSTHRIIKGQGGFGSMEVKMTGWITEDGTIHGRCNCSNGTSTDFNGYIKPDLSLYIQFGHDSDKSELSMKPVSDEGEGTYRYQDTNGSYLVFWEEEDF